MSAHTRELAEGQQSAHGATHSVRNANNAFRQFSSHLTHVDDFLVPPPASPTISIAMLFKIRRIEGDLVTTHNVPDELCIPSDSPLDDPRLLHIQDYYFYFFEMRHLTSDTLALFHALPPTPTPQIVPGDLVWAWATFCKYRSLPQLTPDLLASQLAPYVPPSDPTIRFDWSLYLIAAANLDFHLIRSWKTIHKQKLLESLNLPDVTFHNVILLRDVHRDPIPPPTAHFPRVKSGGVLGLFFSAFGIAALVVLILGAPALAHWDTFGINENNERLIVSWLRVLSVLTWLEALCFFLAKAIHRREDLLSDLVRFRMGGVGDSHPQASWHQLRETENGLYDYMKKMWPVHLIDSDEMYRHTVRWFILALGGDQVHNPGNPERALAGKGYWLRAAASVVSTGQGQTWSAVLRWDGDLAGYGELVTVSATDDLDDVWYLCPPKICWKSNQPIIRDVPSYVRLMTGDWNPEKGGDVSWNMAYTTQRMTPGKARAFQRLLEASRGEGLGKYHVTVTSPHGDVSLSEEPADDTWTDQEAVRKGVRGWFDTTGSIVSQVGRREAFAEHWFAWVLVIVSLVIQALLIGCSGLLFDSGTGVRNEWLHVRAEGAGLASLVVLITNYVCEIVWRSERVWFHGLRGRSTARTVEQFCKQRLRGFSNRVNERRGVAAVYGTMLFGAENNGEMTGANGSLVAKTSARCVVAECEEIATAGDDRGDLIYVNGHGRRVKKLGERQWHCLRPEKTTFIMSISTMGEEIESLVGGSASTMMSEEIGGQEIEGPFGDSGGVV